MTMPQNDIRFDRAMSVRELQRMLRVLAFDNLDVPLISVDGIFGQETADAVAAAQAMLRLPSDGRVNFSTWVALVNATHEVRQMNQPPLPMPVYDSDDPADGTDAPCDAAFGAQMMCRSLSRHFANIPEPQLTGLWDDATARDLETIQQICDLPVTGRMDTPTWNALTKAYTLFCRDPKKPH